MTEAEYRQLVLADYHDKLKADLLPSEMISPARKDLKQHCINACVERYDRKDEPVLSSYFGKKENKEAYVIAMKVTVAEKFKTLHNFLKDETIHTDFNNIKLLAWMIDFQPRPYHPDLQVSTSQNSGVPSPRPVRLFTGPSDNPPENDQRKKKIVLIACILAVLVTAGAIIAYNSRPKWTGKEKCMIWEGDHFQPVGCEVQIADRPTLPINWYIVTHFRKILAPDTLTPHAIRKVYYINYRGQISFFNTNGPHPLDTNRRLLPMSIHIYEKYILHAKN